MMQLQSGETVTVRPKTGDSTASTAMTLGILAAIFAPVNGAAVSPIQAGLAFKTPGGQQARFVSEYDSRNVARTLERLVNYFLEEEPVIPVDVALTTRRNFREMYDRF